MKIAQYCWYSDHIGKILIMMRITIISIQLLDELAILWVIVASYWLWFPQVSSIPHLCHNFYWRWRMWHNFDFVTSCRFSNGLLFVSQLLGVFSQPLLLVIWTCKQCHHSIIIRIATLFLYISFKSNILWNHYCQLLNHHHNHYPRQNCLPSYWKSQENGREHFCRLFVPGAAVTTVLGFIQPVRKHHVCCSGFKTCYSCCYAGGCLHGYRAGCFCLLFVPTTIIRW